MFRYMVNVYNFKQHCAISFYRFIRETKAMLSIIILFIYHFILLRVFIFLSQLYIIFYLVSIELHQLYLELQLHI